MSARSGTSRRSSAAGSTGRAPPHHPLTGDRRPTRACTRRSPRARQLRELGSNSASAWLWIRCSRTTDGRRNPPGPIDGGSLQHRFGQSAHRGDADAGGDQQHVPSLPAGRVHDPVGALDHDLGARPQRGQCPGAVAGGANGDPQPVGGGHRGHGERMRPGPARPAEESPLTELAGLQPEPVQAPCRTSRSRRRPLTPGTTASTRIRCRRLRTSGVTNRHSTSASGGGSPQPPPEDRRHRGCGEVGAGPELVRQGQGHAEVGVQVNQVPGLVPQPAAGRPDRGDDNRDQRQRCRRWPAASPGRP